MLVNNSTNSFFSSGVRLFQCWPRDLLDISSKLKTGEISFHNICLRSCTFSSPFREGSLRMAKPLSIFHLVIPLPSQKQNFLSIFLNQLAVLSDVMNHRVLSRYPILQVLFLHIFHLKVLWCESMPRRRPPVP